MAGRENDYEEVTRRFYPQIRTSFIRTAEPLLQGLQDLDALSEDVRRTVTSMPPAELADLADFVEPMVKKVVRAVPLPPPVPPARKSSTKRRP